MAGACCHTSSSSRPSITGGRTARTAVTRGARGTREPGGGGGGGRDSGSLWAGGKGRGGGGAGRRSATGGGVRAAGVPPATATWWIACPSRVGENRARRPRCYMRQPRRLRGTGRQRRQP